MNIQKLSQDINTVKSAIQKSHTFSDYVRLAVLEDYMCGVAHERKDNGLLKQSAQDGLNAAQAAIRLNPNAAEAHWLAGDLMGQLITVTFAGGMRYGPQAGSELEKALSLDPKSAAACVARGVSYYFTPKMFGGSPTEATTLLNKAISLEPNSDSANTAHIFLAMIYQQEGKHADALHEISLARKQEPDREFAQNIYRQVSLQK